MTEELTLDVTSDGDHTILDLAGEIDIHTAPTLRGAVIELTDSGADRLIIDLTKVTFIDSIGLGVLILAQKKLRLRRGSLDIIASTRRILAIFKLAGLDQAFQIHPTLDSVFAEGDPAEPA